MLEYETSLSAVTSCFLLAWSFFGWIIKRFAITLSANKLIREPSCCSWLSFSLELCRVGANIKWTCTFIYVWLVCQSFRNNVDRTIDKQFLCQVQQQGITAGTSVCCYISSDNEKWRCPVNAFENMFYINYCDSSLWITLNILYLLCCGGH